MSSERSNRADPTEGGDGIEMASNEKRQGVRVQKLDSSRNVSKSKRDRFKERQLQRQADEDELRSRQQQFATGQHDSINNSQMNNSRVNRFK